MSVLICLTLCLLLAGAGCEAAGLSPAACEGYAVVPADDASKGDLRWSDYLRDHLQRRAEGGDRLVSDHAAGEQIFRLTVQMDTLLKGDFSVDRDRRGVWITARDERTMLWLQYQLMKSLSDEDPRIEGADLPPATVSLRDTAGQFAFEYRSLYTPAAQDEDLLGILSVENVESGWGLWGHQLDRVLAGDVPREVFATVGGEVYDGQFCFTSDAAFRRIEAYIVESLGGGDTPSKRFVIAPADDEAICMCKTCSAVGNTPKAATPAVMQMLVRLAERFPRHLFFTLGYLSTLEPPAVAMPANTGVIVSAMELPFSADALNSAEGKRFAARLDRWKNVTNKVYIWDYIQNFDDYLTPFPVLERMAERLRFYRSRGVGGVFLNGSGYDYVPFDDVRTYVLAALLRDPDLSVEVLMQRYFAQNYPVTSDLLADFCVQAERHAAASDKGLNLYGSIRDAEAAWMNASAFAAFYDALGQVLPTTKDLECRQLHRLLTALSYTRLEMARRYAAQPLGLAEQKEGRLYLKPQVDTWLAALQAHASFADMKYISESGLAIGDYIDAWRDQILRVERPENRLLEVELKAISRPDELYADLGVLTDGVAGLCVGYHYGWHISSVDLEIEIPAQTAVQVRRFGMSFLEMPRHRLRAPRSVELYKDGILYKTFVPTSDATGGIFTVLGSVDFSDAKRITVKVLRSEDGRVQLAADEIYLIP